MNVIHTLSNLLVPPSARFAPTQDRLARRAACAEALAAARRRNAEPDRPPTPDEADQAAYEAQARRVRESSYLSGSGRLFQVH
ncbi:hypothetical protein ACFOED_05825 [Vulcaniibacterium thermophilum]|uniref:Uncharacterized protein n=1 Tax=Vulcaniibacterium thermophilum TaxID=1169913 RepID=A0A918YUN5_9GAMM|nr:hypothetical protein [Vulcaniibacterium thermophilum]GHE25034.1 hypothetical protein GCM10007167_01230 [Vulcaniibacterium thermophilum]